MITFQCQSRDHLSRVNCPKKIILHIDKQLEARVLGKRLNLEKMFKTSHVSETHAFIQVRVKTYKGCVFFCFFLQYIKDSRVENTTRRGVFLTKFKVFAQPTRFY